MAENTIDNLSIQVVASAERAISTFNRLASGASGLRGAARGAAGGMQDMAQGARDAGTATQEAGTQSGEASRTIGKFWNSLRSVGSRIGGGFVQAVHRGTAAVGTFLKSIARIAFYRIIRSIIKDLGQSFRDLYGYSRLFGTDFAKSMDRITTASVYLRNSLAAMVAPLVNLFAPALDMLADKIVDILNFVNQLFAAINGQETYTVAKKVATTWESTFDSAADHANKRIKEVRNTLLGFDEINRLNGETPTTSGSTGSSPYTPGYSTMFEEKPLEGFFADISNVTSGWPDWLKWLLGIGAVGIGAWGISKLPGLIGKIFDAFKNLFSITLPDWLRWLFGPKGDNDIGLDIPDKIDLPDADVPVNLKQGDWSVLQEIPTEKYLLLKVGVKMDGWLGNGNPQLPGNQPLVIDDNGSDTWDFTFQQAAMGANNLQAINNQLENMVDNWDDLAWEVAKMASGTIIDKTLRVAVKRSNSWDKTAWDAANFSDGTVTRTVTAVVNQGNWDNTAWLAATMTAYTAPRTVTATVKKGEWDATAWTAALMTAYAITRTATAIVKKGEWDAAAWLAANMTAYAITRTITAVVQKGAWDATAWSAANMTSFAPTRTVTSVVKKGDWDNTAWSAANMTSYSPTRTVTSVVKKGAWDDTAWIAATMTNYTVTRTVNVELKKKDWTTVTDFVDDSFGGATGGGGKTSGGGAGRGGRSIPVDLQVNATSGLGTTVSKTGTVSFSDISSATGKVKAKAVKGTGTKVTSTGTVKLTDIEKGSTSITADVVKKKAWASTIGGTITYLHLNDLATSITASLKKVSEWKTQGIGKYLDITTKTQNVEVGINKKWGTQKPLDYLGLSGLTAVIKTKLEKTANNKIEYSFGGGGISKDVKAFELKRHGGVFSNGRWSNIPQYANGTLNAGTIFAAGEAGPEVVGHVGGRTEVLNKSQLASAMFSAVQAAMAPAAANFASAAQSMGVANVSFDFETLAEMVRQGVEQAMARSNDYDRQKVALLQQINEKDYNPEISTSSINKAQQRMNRRAGTTIVPVGT